MSQFDAGPGDWSDREWESPEKKQKPQAKRRLSLPPLALVAALVGLVIILCVGLVLVVRALRGGGAKATPTAVPAEASAEIQPSPTYSLETPGAVITATATAELPLTVTTEPGGQAGIYVGATVVVQGTGAKHLRVRSQPTTSASTLTFANDGTSLLVLDGPRKADGYTWWKVRTPDKVEGWAASDFLKLK